MFVAVTDMEIAFLAQVMIVAHMLLDSVEMGLTVVRYKMVMVLGVVLWVCSSFSLVYI